MKVLLGAHHFPPRYMGGVELITLRLAQALQQRGFQVEVVAVESIDAPRDMPVRCETNTYDGLIVHRLHLNLLNEPNAFHLNYCNPHVADWFTRFMHNARPDLVHLQSGYLLSASLIEATKACGVACIVSLHDYWFICPQITLLHPNGGRCNGPEPAKCAWCLKTEQRRYRLPDEKTGGLLGQLARGILRRPKLAQWAGWASEVEAINARRQYLLSQLRQADALVTQAPLVRDLLIQQGLAAEHIRLVKYGLDLSAWRGLIKTFASHIRVGYLGNLSPHKGMHILVRALRQVRANHRSLELHIYGDMKKDPAYTQYLCQLADNDPDIHFWGRYENARVEELLSNIDVLVVPSLWYETGPLVTLEAFAARTPVIASNIPNMCYQVEHAVDGLLFEAGDVGDLTRCLQRLVDEPDLLPCLTQGVSPVRQFSTEVEELMALYTEFGN